MTYYEGHWAPIVLETLFHAHALASPMRSAPAVQESIATLVKGDLIERADTSSGWRTTQRGKVHLENLCALPYPCNTWEDKP